MLFFEDDAEVNIGKITTSDIADYPQKLGSKNMPNSVVQSYATKSGKSVKYIEDMWKEIEKSVRANPKYKNLSDDRIYAIVNGSVKRNLGLKERDEFSDKILKHLEEE